jgi:hypothetical protein
VLAPCLVGVIRHLFDVVHHAVQVPLRIALALIPIAVERLAPRADTHITLGIVGKVLWPEQLERSTDSITHLVVKRVGLGLMFSSFGESFITLAQSPTKWLAFVNKKLYRNDFAMAKNQPTLNPLLFYNLSTTCQEIDCPSGHLG